LVIQVQIF